MSKILDSLRELGREMSNADTPQALQPEPTPIPFEIEYPEEAKVHIGLLASKKGRRRLQHLINEPEPKKPKVGRNEPCPCGSGKKFKQCHGKLG